MHAQLHFSAGFHTKTLPVWADRGTEMSLASKPMRGDKMRVFSRMCARFPGWFPRRFFARTRFLEVCATTFSAHRAGICPHMAGQLIVSRGTKRAQKIGASRVARCGMGSFLRSFLFFWAQRGCVFLFRWRGVQGSRFLSPPHTRI